MKFCKNCSAALEDDAMFCTECGASLTDDFKPANNNTASQQKTTGEYEGFQGSIPTPSSSTNNNNAGGNEQPSGNSYSSNNDYSSGTNYNQPNQYSAPQGKNPGTPWLIVSIISFVLCCCNVFAIPGLVFAIMSTTSFNAGNIVEAEERANTAKWLTIGALILWVIVQIIFYATGWSTQMVEGIG